MATISRLQSVVSERGESLRALSVAELLRRANTPTETFRLGWSTATIDLVIEQRTPGQVRVIIQGFLRFPSWSPLARVALDGFYKRVDGALEPVPEDELNEFS